MDNKVNCKMDAPHTKQQAFGVVMAKNAAGGKWKAIHCQECSLWHVERVEVKVETSEAKEM